MVFMLRFPIGFREFTLKCSTKKTVVIVGAGASKDFGLPTGANVYSNLLKETLTNTPSGHQYGRDVFSGGFKSFLAYANNYNLEHQLPLFINAVKNDGVANSIDLFADYYPEFTEISKLYSTWSILSTMYKKKMPKQINQGYPSGFDHSYLSPSEVWLNSQIPIKNSTKSTNNWLSALLRKHLEDTDLENEISNNLTVITFNYDTIIEDFFSSSIKKLPKYRDYVSDLIPPVMHVYGAFNALNDYPVTQDIFNHAENISYIHDEVHENRENSLVDIKNTISKAETIFIVGFDAATQNCERVHLAKSQAYKFALNYSGNIGLNNRLESVGVSPSNIMTGSLPKACNESFFDQGDNLVRPVIIPL